MWEAKDPIDRCRYDHPSKNLQTQNRFGVFQSPENERTSNRSNGSYGGMETLYSVSSPRTAKVSIISIHEVTDIKLSIQVSIDQHLASLLG